jgi:hypothetical protein
MTTQPSIAFVAAIVLVLQLFGCGGKEATPIAADLVILGADI